MSAKVKILEEELAHKYDYIEKLEKEMAKLFEQNTRIVHEAMLDRQDAIQSKCLLRTQEVITKRQNEAIDRLEAERDELRDFIITIAKDLCIWAKRKDEPALYEIIDTVEDLLNESWTDLLSRIDKEGK